MGTSIPPVSNPVTNPMSPSLAGAMTGNNGANHVPGGKMGKDEFLKLLTVQLSHQDPMDPMDGKQMAADLAQFSGLEQLLNINEALATQQGQYDSLVLAMNNNVAMGAVGKSVVIESDKVLLTKDSQGVMTGKVMADISESGVAKLTLLDKSGKEVGSRSLGYIAAGAGQTFDVDTAATNLPEDVYQFRIDVADGSGANVPQKTYTVGTIDGLTYGEGGKALLTMGPLTIAYSAIVKILA